MTCYKPLKGFKSRQASSTGGYQITFDKRKALAGSIKMTVPCGQCIGCRLDRSREWAIRCVHEASLYEENCFITLTYNPEHLPEDQNLNKSHFQKFIKRLRKKYPNKKIRYYHAGEYGEKCQECGENRFNCECTTFIKGIGRPHYHAIIFNLNFADKKYFKEVNKQILYTSKTLDKIWGKGFTSIGTVTFESAAYVARYIMKKVNGANANEHYTINVNQETGEIQDPDGIIKTVQAEYTTMSRRPGIAKGWYDKYKDDIYPSDSVVIAGKQLKPPRFYQKIYQQEEPKQFLILKKKRRVSLEKIKKDTTPERLAVREHCKLVQLKQLKRTL